MEHPTPASGGSAAASAPRAHTPLLQSTVEVQGAPAPASSITLAASLAPSPSPSAIVPSLAPSFAPSAWCASDPLSTGGLCVVASGTGVALPSPKFFCETSAGAVAGVLQPVNTQNAGAARSDAVRTLRARKIVRAMVRSYRSCPGVATY
jgi:hypothetical protein